MCGVRHEVAQYTVKHPFRKRLHRAGGLYLTPCTATGFLSQRGDEVI